MGGPPIQWEVSPLAVLINLTPHDLHIYNGDDEHVATIPAHGQVARCRQERQRVGEVHFPGASGDDVEIPINATSFGALEGLPDPAPGFYYIVSAITAQAAKAAGRTDVLITDDAVRDSEGRIIGCRALARI